MIANFRKRNIFAVCALALATFALYFNTLYNGFVWDDLYQVQLNAWIRSFKFLPDILARNSWEFAGKGSNFYRPGMHLGYMVVYHFYGLAPWGYHLLNILFNMAVSVMVFLLALEVFETGGIPSRRAFGIAFFSALLFTAHPVHTEAVAWIASFPELSYTLFYLLSLYFFILWRKGKIKEGISLSCLFFVLSFMCKETALSLPLAIAAYEIAFPDETRPVKGWLKMRCLKNLLPYFLLAAAYFILRMKIVGLTRNAKADFQLTNFQFTLNAIVNFSLYICQLIYPFNLNAYHVFHPVHSFFEWKGLASFSIMTAFTGFVFFAFKKDRPVFFSLAVIVIPLLPALYLPAFQPENTYAERYLYLPSMGFAFVAARLVYSEKIKKIRFAVLAAAVFLVTVYSIKTVTRNTVWKNETSFWSDTVKKSPDGWLPNNQMGIVLGLQGEYEEAADHFRAAMRLNPYEIDPPLNLGFTLLDQGNTGSAERLFKRITGLLPSSCRAHTGLGIACMKEGRFSRAQQELRAAIKLNPDSAQAHKYMGMVYEAQGDFDAAIVQFKFLAKLAPSPENYNFLGGAYLKQDLRDKAATSYQAALQIDPADSVALKALKALSATTPRH